MSSVASVAEGIEVQARDFVATRYLDVDQQETVREKNSLGGTGEADYAFDVIETGWYELWVEAAQWATDLYLDNAFLMHTPFASGVWEPRGRLQKVTNLYLPAGAHTLRFRRTWHPGLNMRRFVLEPARDVTGIVRLALHKDYLCFRRGEEFPVTLQAGRGADDYTLDISIIDTANDQAVRKLPQTVPAGQGLFEQKIAIPTDMEGVYDIRIAAADGQIVDRITQFLVVDTGNPPAVPPELTRDLVMTVPCATREPDYANGATRVVDGAMGAYRESGDRGHVEYSIEANWFTYTLALPSVQEPYLLEVDYPDDDERTFTYSIIEKDVPGGRALTHGVASGGIYRLSGDMQTAQMVFYPRQRDPRVQLRTWWSGQRAAAAEIRVYRITSGFPSLLAPDEDGGRLFGRYQEEPLRFVQWGARAEGNQWRNMWDSAERIGQFSRYAGVNFWHPAIAIYGATLWPNRYLPSLDRDADLWATVGPTTLKEPVAKDSVRLMLLVAEKYGMDFVGELFMPCGRPVARSYFEDRFGGDGDIGWADPNAKPWLIVHRDGTSPGSPLYNPLYPGIQDWVADIIGELAERYKDSPAFKGIGLRFMGWQFFGWQGLPSIDWGYGDYTIGQFEKGTGIGIPVEAAAKDRFGKRYEWLMANAYDRWVQWRCEQVYRYHARLAGILTEARPDLKLFLDLHGPTFGSGLDADEYEQKGWKGLLQETGIDPDRCRAIPALVIRERRHYPPGIRGTKTKEPLERAGRIAAFYDPAPISETSEPADGGTRCAMHFDANSYESNIGRLTDMGIDKLTWRNSKEIHGAGLVFPAGRHFLERYAQSMADGNLTSITDGSHGYICWPQDLLREFTSEYRRLPDIGMQRLPGTGDPVALWHGRKDGSVYFYVVNRSSYPVDAEIALPAGATVQRLATKEAHRGPVVRVLLAPFSLRSFTGAESATPTGLRISGTDEARERIAGQIAFVDALLSSDSPDDPITLFSQVDLQRATAKLADARQALDAGQVWTPRRWLLHPHLVKVYAALDSYPPGLYYRKAPDVPDTAWRPQQVLAMLSQQDRGNGRLLKGKEIGGMLTGEDVLVLTGEQSTLEFDAPLTNRYRLSFAYVGAGPYACPGLRIDGKAVPGQAPAKLPSGMVCGRHSVLPPLVMKQGRHALDIVAGRGASTALLQLHVEPQFRSLVMGDWQIIGPFPSERQPRVPGTGLDIVYPPEKERDFEATYTTTDGETVSWIRPHTNDLFVDVYAVTGAYADRVGYASTTIHSPEARDAELRFGVDYWGRIWLNGEQVFEMVEGHGAPCAAQFRIPVKLRKGDNELLVKIHAGSRGNGFWMSVSDPGDLRVAQLKDRGQ